VKVEAIQRLGARIVAHGFADWWSIVSTRETGANDGIFIHPVCEPGVFIGNGTIGLDEDWPELDTVFVPFGGGGLASGIALALRALSREVRIVACEIETSTPLTAAIAAGKPVPVERRPSFVDGIGSNSVLNEMWPLVREVIDDVAVVSVLETRAAVRELALNHHLIAEGAGAIALAAALSAHSIGSRVAAIISGGNIDQGHLVFNPKSNRFVSLAIFVRYVPTILRAPAFERCIPRIDARRPMMAAGFLGSSVTVGDIARLRWISRKCAISKAVRSSTP
jgi:threonine dehydratase